MRDGRKNKVGLNLDSLFANIREDGGVPDRRYIDSKREAELEK